MVWAIRVMDEMVRVLNESKPEQISAAIRALNISRPDMKDDRHLMLQIAIGKDAFMLAGEVLRANEMEDNAQMEKKQDSR